jgi:hypothetical protein
MRDLLSAQVENTLSSQPKVGKASTTRLACAAKPRGPENNEKLPSDRFFEGRFVCHDNWTPSGYQSIIGEK